jgi:HEAT repeat protein
MRLVRRVAGQECRTHPCAKRASGAGFSLRKPKAQAKACATALLLLTAATALAAVDEATVRALARNRDAEGLKALGAEMLPVLARVYEASTPDERANIAALFYQIGWKSPEAKRALMADVHTRHQTLRLQAQWALGRVSGDDDVVDVLLGNLQNDPNPLFRDKAACALANDQIHVSPQGKVRLYEGLIFALDDPKLQVRQIALQALQVLTGQTKGFQPAASPEERQKSVAVWKKWLQDYRSNL